MGPYVIGIAGVSCAGKTRIAAALAGRLEAERPAAIVALDSFYRDLSHLVPKNRTTIDFDDPAAIDFDELVRDLEKLIGGETVLVPRYRYDTHTRAPRDEWRTLRLDAGEPRAVLVVEGLHALFDDRLRRRYDLSVFVDASPALCLDRRILRDVRDRGRAEADVRERFARHVVPAQERFVLPARARADLVLDGASPVERSVDAIIIRAGFRRRGAERPESNG